LSVTTNHSLVYSAATKLKLFAWIISGACLVIVGATFYRTERLFAATEEPEEFRGPPPHPGYPDPFDIGYTLLDTISPNKHYGVIYPTRLLEDSPDFVVDIKNSRILALIETDEPYFEGKNHGSLSANWSPDSSAVIIENGGKWSPLALVLVEMKDGKVLRQTQLLDQLEKIFSPAVAKAQHTNPKTAGVSELDITSVKWETGKSLQAEIKCEGETNPKAFEDQSSWHGELTAVWDLAQRRFIQHKMAHVSFRPAGKEEQ
jgi:hypothetical protein